MLIAALLVIAVDTPTASLNTQLPPFDERLLIWNVLATGHQRSQAYLDMERYFAAAARLGYTAIDVNALATLEIIEQEDPSDLYPLFNTYGPSLSQFVDSDLTRGVYPKGYLERNLAQLRERARLAHEHGLKAVFATYEPRWMPDVLYVRHPELRGARSDHPGRSKRARYSLDTDRPEVLRHYQQLVGNLLRAVPEIDYLIILTQDSGAAFCWAEYTYGGPNGPERCRRIPVSQRVSGFLEAWRAGIAEARSSARLVLWAEQFTGEELNPLIDQLPKDVALAYVAHYGTSVQLGERSFELPWYAIQGIELGTRTKSVMQRAAKAGRVCYLLNVHDYGMDIDPILGLPIPFIVYDRLEEYRRQGVRNLINFGGIVAPPVAEAVAGQEVFREVVSGQAGNRESTVRRVAERLGGAAAAESLVRGWRAVDDTMRMTPPNFGQRLGALLVWRRFLVRPLVVAHETLSADERAYFARHTFLGTGDKGWTNFFWEANRPRLRWEDAPWTIAQYQRMSRRLSEAIAAMTEARGKATTEDARGFIETESQKTAVLRSVLTTLENILRVQYLHDKYTEFYQDAFTDDWARDREEYRAAVLEEIANTGELRALLQQARRPLIAQSKVEENTFIYGPDLPALLQRKVEIMRRHLAEVDQFFAWRR